MQFKANETSDSGSQLLTIAIPTFNRKEVVSETVEALISSGQLGSIFDLLVIDNASPDGTHQELLSKHGDVSGFRVLCQTENLGFARNFLSLLKACKTPYALILSDEDDVILENLPNYASWLADCSPDFASPIAEMHIPGWPARGMGAEQTISPSLLSAATFYISGLTYRVPYFSNHLDPLWSQVDSSKFVYYYPQTALLAKSVLTEKVSKAFFYPRPITRQRVVAPSDDMGYTSAASRLEQHETFVNFLSESQDFNPESVKKVVALAGLELKSGLWVAGQRTWSNLFGWLFIFCMNLWKRRHLLFSKQTFPRLRMLLRSGF